MTAATLTMSERQLQDAVVEMATWMKWRHYHVYDSRRSVPGFPDLVLVRGGRLIFAELKTDRSKVTAEQRAWLDDLSSTFAEVYLWRPVDWVSGDIERCLR